MFQRIGIALMVVAAALVGGAALLTHVERDTVDFEPRFIVEHTARNVVRPTLTHAPRSWVRAFDAWEARRNAKQDLSVGIYALYVSWTEEWLDQTTWRALYSLGIMVTRVSPSDSMAAVDAYNQVMAAEIVGKYGCSIPLPPAVLEPHCPLEVDTEAPRPAA